MQIDRFHQLLRDSNYDRGETEFLINGLRHGFSLGYEGQRNITLESDNIPFRGVGDALELWEKMMKETKLKRFAGPFSKEQIPFEFYVQSPVGLVPKGEGQTRLIFHLSYEFGENRNYSINGNTPKEKCSVKYKDLDFAVQACLKLIGCDSSAVIWFSKSDLKSAFHLLRIRPSDWPLLFMKVKSPEGEIVYFFDKCLPFGASISCSHFQRFSNGLCHVFEFATKMHGLIPNYLDDFLFMALCRLRCNELMRIFLELCEELCIPVSVEKTEWASTLMIFLGILLDGMNKVMGIPEDKKSKALMQLKTMLDKKSARVHQLQQLAGLLNFLNRAVVPVRAFTRRMYAKFSGFTQIGFGGKVKHKVTLKPHHHVRLDSEFKQDCRMWVRFLELPLNYLAVARPFVDLSSDKNAVNLQFFSDASLAETKGFGCYFDKQFSMGTWEPNFIRQFKPSIAYLELYALCVAIFTWSNKLRNRRVIVACDNQAAVNMVNHSTSGCRNCMYLLRELTLRGLEFNFRVFARYLTSRANELADALSRGQMDRFRRLAPRGTASLPEQLPGELWPLSRIWIK